MSVRSFILKTSRFDDEANEYVYLFQRVEGFSLPRVTSVENRGEKNLAVKFLKVLEIETFLNSKMSGSALVELAEKELAYQKVNNDYSLKTINTRSLLHHVQEWPQEDIEKIMKSINRKKDAPWIRIKRTDILESVKTRQAYENRYLKRKSNL